jgi:two-component system NtrC family sensor kinase
MNFNMSPVSIKPEFSTSINFVVPSVAQKEQILIVDDSITVRKVLARCLSKKYECVEASSVNDALSHLKQTKFALVISDVMMPGISGTELLRKIVASYPDTAVIMVSGVDQPKRALDAVRLGAFDYLFKPCEMDVLELTVERALERRQLLINARQHKLDLQARNEELALGKAKLERLQAQIVHSEKMASLGQLAAGIAHELNNPVGFIYGNMDLLIRYVADLTKLLRFYDQADLPEAIANPAASIKDQIHYQTLMEDLESVITDSRDGAERIRDIVQNLRTFSRLDEAEFTQTDVHEGINSTIRLLSRYFRADNIKLCRDFGVLPPIEAFSSQLNQVWMNLLVNAAQAVSKKGGTVKITTRVLKDSFVAVSISDNGEGIAPEYLNRIFDPFFTTKPVGEGTGLGLSISFGIIKRHNGTIEVRSRPNEGTAFLVTLPIRPKKPETSEKLNKMQNL